jgi:HK97 family phage major capsid protein
MFKSKAMNTLIAALAAAQTAAQAVMAKAGATVEEINATAQSIKALKAKIEAQEIMDAGKEFDEAGEEVKDTKPVNEPLHATPKAAEKGLKLFDNFADQLKAVRNAAINGTVDQRLAKLNAQNAALGANESNPDEGGYAVQSDFAGAMLETASKSGDILSRVDRYEISGPANRVAWTEIDESDISTTVYGGVQVYWAAEAASVTAKKPKLTEKELKLQKLMGVAYATYELENDSNFISQLYTKAFNEAIQRELESCIVSTVGTGAGKPTSIMKGGAYIQVAKETGQAADTVSWENIVKMYNRAFRPSSAGYIWLMHDDVSEQLDFLSFPIGTGGVPVYLPAALAGSVPTLKSKPVVTSDQCSALGDLGDINYVDLSQYMLIVKGGVQADTSMHVQFLTAENCYRFIFRANGMPKRNKALTIKNSSNPRSPYVGLAERA